MNPNWKESQASIDMAKAKPRTSDVSGGRRTSIMFAKNEVGYEHPAKGSDHCGICAHFRAPHKCVEVVGYIRREDWCQKFEMNKRIQESTR